MKTTEQLAHAHGTKLGHGSYAFLAEELEALRAACIKDYFESAEPVGGISGSRRHTVARQILNARLRIPRKTTC